MNLDALTPSQKHQVGVYLAAAETVIHGHKVKVVERWGATYALQINENSVRVFVRASASYIPSTFAFEYRRALSDTEVTAAVLVDVLTEPAGFYVVPKDVLGSGIGFNLEAWRGRWGLL